MSYSYLISVLFPICTIKDVIEDEKLIMLLVMMPFHPQGQSETIELVLCLPA